MPRSIQVFVTIFTAFNKWKKLLEMLLWTYTYIKIYVQELNKINKFVWWKYQPGDCS